MSKTTIWILSAIGFFLILTACLNFINLATAQSIGRAKEVGVRKVLGGMRRQWFWQFTMETLAIVVLSFLLSFCAAYTLLPYVNVLLGPLQILHLFDRQLLLFSIVLIIVITVLSGSYPAMILSGFRPLVALKGKLSTAGTGRLNLRRFLITAQFTISQVLLIGLIVIMYQMDYVKQADMGFDKNNVVMIPIGSGGEKMKTLKEQFLGVPGVINVSLCFAAPASESSWGTSIHYDNRSEAEVFSVQFKGADADYITTFGIDLVAGRNLEPSDTVREFLVNETFVHKIGVSAEEILGKSITSMGIGPVQSWE